MQGLLKTAVQLNQFGREGTRASFSVRRVPAQLEAPTITRSLPDANRNSRLHHMDSYPGHELSIPQLFHALHTKLECGELIE